MILTDKDLELIEKLKALGRELGRKPTRDEFVASGVSFYDMRKITFNGLLRLAGFELHPNQKLDSIDPILKPRILILDIETAPLKVWSYGIREQHHGLESIDEDWTILSFAAKWLDSEEVIYHAVSPLDTRNDIPVIREAFFLLNQADVVIAHNANFDIKMLRSRFLFYEFPETRPFRTICTYQVAKRHFRLTSYKLEYVAKYLRVIEKLDHAKFPGMKLFKECAAGNVEAFRELEDYNIRDIITTEAVYLKLRKYDKSIRWNVFFQDNQCECGGQDFRKLEPIITNVGAFNCFQCVDCGSVKREKSNLISPAIRKGLLV